MKVTFIFAGDHKVDGNPYEPLPESVKDRIQERIDRIYGVFVGTVARNRGMDEEEVRATQALTYDAQDSISQRLADRIGALDEELVAFASEAPETEDDTQMSFTQEQMDAATAQARAEGVEAGRAEGLKQGAAAERERAEKIMGSDEGKERPTAARAAVEAGLDADTAIAMLAKLPTEKAEPKGKAKTGGDNAVTAFEKAMGVSNPEVGANGDGDDDEQMSDGKVVEGIFASANFAPAKRA